MRMLLLGGAALAAFAAYPLLAQNDAARRPEQRAAWLDQHVEQRFAAMDANKDGVVTKAEYENARAKRWAEMEDRRVEMRERAFARLDTNKDGMISKQEFAAAPPPPPLPGRDGMAPPPPTREGMAPPPPPPGGPMAMRRGGPGMAAMGDRWFDRADLNKDGKVTLAEAKQAAHDMAARRMAMRDGGHPRGPWGKGGPGGDVPPAPRKPE